MQCCVYTFFFLLPFCIFQRERDSSDRDLQHVLGWFSTVKQQVLDHGYLLENNRLLPPVLGVSRSAAQSEGAVQVSRCHDGKMLF